MAILWAQMKDRSFWGEILHFKHLARFGGKYHGRQDLQGEKNNNNNKAESFFRLNFNAYINVDNREKARARNKTTTTTKTNLVGRKTSTFYSGATKMEMPASTRVKMSGREKPKWTKEHKHFLHKTCN